MPLITFTNPDYKDKTVYAVAGSFTETVLKIAKQNKIPMSFDCENGECSSCLIHVTYLDTGCFVKLYYPVSLYRTVSGSLNLVMSQAGRLLNP